MRYFFLVLLFCPDAFCLQRSSSKRLFIPSTPSRYTQEPALSDADKNSRKIQLDDIYTTLLKELVAYVQPEQIQHHLDIWDALKTPELNMQTNQIERIIVTARSMPELALHVTHVQSQNSELQSSKKVQFTRDGTNDSSPTVQKYINAQLNYDKICNHLGIKK